MSAPYEFEGFDGDVELGDMFELGETEAEWGGRFGRRPRPGGWSGRPRVIRRFGRFPRPPISRPGRRFPGKPRPRFPVRSLFPIILPSWGGWLAQPPAAGQGAAEPSAWPQAAPPAAGPSRGAPPADEPPYGGPSVSEPPDMGDDQQQPDGSPPDAAPSADASADGDAPQAETARVRWLQTCLNRALGLRLPITGVLDAPTRSATRSFQRMHGLPADGAVSRETATALNEITLASRTTSPDRSMRSCGCAGASHKRHGPCRECQQQHGSQRSRF
jgi:hypothetical protein